MTEQISIIVSISQEILRVGLISVFEASEKFDVVAQPLSIEETLQAVAAFKDALLLLKEHRMSCDAYLEFAQVVHKENAGTKIILLDAPITEKDFDVFLNCGVHADLKEPITGKSVCCCLESVAQGGKWFGLNCETDGKDCELSMDLPERIKNMGELSYREQEVFLLLAQGFTNQGIATNLCISKDTVKSHVHHIMGKFAASNRGQLVLKVRTKLKELSSCPASDKPQTYLP